MACDPAALMAAAKCNLSYLDRATLDAVEIRLLCAIRDGDTSMACDPQTLVQEAQCLLSCIPQGAMSSVKLGLLCQIAEAGGGGGGTGPAGPQGPAGPAGTPAVTPQLISDNLTGLKLWVRSDSVVGVDGTPQPTLVDLSGNGNSFTQATVAKQPLLKNNIVNGKPVFRCDAVDDGMTSGLTIGAGAPYTIFLVYSHLRLNTSNARLLNSNGQNWLIGPHGGAHRWYIGVMMPGEFTTVANQFQVFAYRCTGTKSTWWNNGLILSSAGIPTNFPAQITIGTDGSTPGEPAGSDLAECGIYNIALTNDQINNIMAGLRAYYAITAV